MLKTSNKGIRQNANCKKKNEIDLKQLSKCHPRVHIHHHLNTTANFANSQTSLCWSSTIIWRPRKSSTFFFTSGIRQPFAIKMAMFLRTLMSVQVAIMQINFSTTKSVLFEYISRECSTLSAYGIRQRAMFPIKIGSIDWRGGKITDVGVISPTSCLGIGMHCSSAITTPNWNPIEMHSAVGFDMDANVRIRWARSSIAHFISGPRDTPLEELSTRRWQSVE